MIDRFNKQNFVAEHAESGPFLSEFMETQMFQCFVDERYLQAGNAEIDGGCRGENWFHYQPFAPS